MNRHPAHAARRTRWLGLATVVAAAAVLPAAGLAGQVHHHPDTSSARMLQSGRMLVPMLDNPMLPALRGLRPSTGPFLPAADRDPASFPMAVPTTTVDMADGDTLALEATIVRRTVAGRTFVMYGFNGQTPGPMIRVGQGATVHVRFTNRIDLPTTVHWHGVRLDNQFDGVPGLTQDPVEPGRTFWYTVRFPDAGIYWYHPHVREDIQQELGLYGNMLVRSPREGYDNPVNREEVLALDDILVDESGLVPFGREVANFAIMGRFGNVPLLNGEDDYALAVGAGEVVRFYLTNVSNTRTYNLSFGDAPMKLVGADIGRFEREMMVRSVAIAPAQRYIVEVYFAEPGSYPLESRIQGIDHMRGEFFAAVDTLGRVDVGPASGATRFVDAFRRLGEDVDVQREVAPHRSQIDRAPDRELLLTVAIADLPILLMQFISIDTTYRPPVEWTDPMPNMNWLATSNEVRWILRDLATGAENMDIDWRFRVGEVVKIRLRNDPKAFHPMNHPVHLHGQRFLVLARDGVPNQNMAWKDTALLPVGATVDILLEVTNPGRWMLHCHIAEHLDAGMMMAFAVD